MTARSPRQWRSEGFLPFRLEVLTPVHIGSGDVLSPLEYVIRKKNGKARLYRIDLQSWLMRHGSEQSVQNIIATGDISRIRRMLDEKVDEAAYAVSSSPIPDLSLAEDLGQALGGALPKSKTGDVAAALRNPLDNSLYIPGSSLKGAMNTPLINWLDGLLNKMGRPPLRDDPNKLKTMFGSISEHAMQALKVSDVAAPLSACAVVRARERNLDPKKNRNPASCEAIMPDCGDMWGRFLLDSPKGTPAITLPGGKTIPFAELVRLCNAFYSKRFTEEMKKFYSLPHFRDVHAALCETQKKVMGLGSDSMLLRAGHYSHVESVTVDKNQPRTRKGKDGKPMPSGTTRTLADGRLPFGWVLLHFCSPEEYEAGMAEAEAARRASVAEQTEQIHTLRQKAEEQAAQAALLKHQQEERRLAEAQKAAEEQKKREDLERRMAELPPEEARLLKLKTDPSEALSMEIFNEMKKWSPELQRKAAEALRDCWLALGKWNGKQSKKQEIKIREVKALLA